MSDIRDKEMVRRAIDDELSFLKGDKDLVEKVVSAQKSERQSRKRYAILHRIISHEKTTLDNQ